MRVRTPSLASSPCRPFTHISVLHAEKREGLGDKNHVRNVIDASYLMNVGEIITGMHSIGIATTYLVL